MSCETVTLNYVFILYFLPMSVHKLKVLEFRN